MFRRLLALIALGGLAVLLAGPGAAQVGGPGGPGGGGFGKKGGRGFGGGPVAPAVVLPEGLSHVPADAVAFVHIRIADSLNGPASLALVKQLRSDGEQGKFVTQIERRLGVRLADLESITLFLLDVPMISVAPASFAKGADADDAPTCLVALTYSKPVDRKAILRALAGKGAPPLWPKLSGLFLTDRCVLVGRPAELLSYTTMHGMLDDTVPVFGGPGGGGWGRPATRTRGSLSAALAAGAEPHLIVAGAQMPPAARTRLRLALRGGAVGPYGALLPLLNTSAAITVDMREAAEITVRFLGSDRLTLEAAQALRTLAEITLDDKDAKLPFALSPTVHKALRKAVAQATIEQGNGRGVGASVEMRLHLEASPDELARLLAQAVVRPR